MRGHIDRLFERLCPGPPSNAEGFHALHIAILAMATEIRGPLSQEITLGSVDSSGVKWPEEWRLDGEETYAIPDVTVEKLPGARGDRIVATLLVMSTEGECRCLSLEPLRGVVYGVHSEVAGNDDPGHQLSAAETGAVLVSLANRNLN